MFSVTYDTWKSVCNMYFSLKTGSKKAYLQWFPFTKLSPADKEELCGEDFYNRYIKTATFVLFPAVIQQSENYLQKTDGSFRNSSLIAPVLFLFLQAVGMEIHNRYLRIRPANISVYYAGNYAHLRPHYKQDYDEFFKELNDAADEYQYFIKTDITNFYANIDVNRLITQIDTVCNADTKVFSQNQLNLFKELLIYCGDGRFPLIENSVASSFLATVVYLDAVDKALYEYISKNIKEISSFRIVRYVDDMYILISSEKPIECLNEAKNEIRNEYSSILKEYGLALNAGKCCFKETKEINQELKKSLYDELFNGQKHDIEELFSGTLLCFLKDLSNELLLDSIDIDRYNGLINKHFSSDDVEFTPSEVFNYYVYENETELKTEAVVNEVVGLVERSTSFISLDPKRLTVMIMKTKSERAIKGLLNQLFSKNRLDKWNSYDTTIAISYLIQSEFKHIDLLNVLRTRQPQLYSYYSCHCKNSTMLCFVVSDEEKLREIISEDSKAVYLYFMYLCEMKRANYMAAFAYYKNFFDRVTADFYFVFNDPKYKKPSYNSFYKKTTLIKFYAGIDNSEAVIEKAHKLRNANPLSHSSSELLDQNNTSKELLESINDLSRLIYEYLDKHRQ